MLNQKIKDYFMRVDPILYSYIDKVELTTHKNVDNVFADLCDIIISQQLSGKAAAAIYERFMQLFPDQTVTPQTLKALPESSIRLVGISWAKVRALKNLAEKVTKKELDLESLYRLSDDEVIKKLTKVRGIGPWTAEMFLMFTLGREDIFSFGDLGLKKGIQKVYGFKSIPTQKQIEKIIRKWSPYKTYGSRILWKVLELKG